MKFLSLFALVSLFCLLHAGEPVAKKAMQAELERINQTVTLGRAFNLIHQLVGPSVVSIHLTARQQVVDNLWQVRTREIQVGEGSGFVVFSDATSSWILTNAHVVVRLSGEREFLHDRTGAPAWHGSIRVELNDRRSHVATPVAVDEQTDMALLKIEEPNLPAVDWGDSDAVLVGDWVLALGYPLGVGYSASAGIISATGRSTGVYQRNAGYEAFLQTDAAINPGNSGGPLVNLRGQVVGVNSNILSTTGASVGLGFAISGNLARNVAEDLRLHGRVLRPMVGIQFDEETDLRVAMVMPHSPAADAGLKAGDLVLSVNGKLLSERNQFRTTVASTRVGQKLEITVERAKKQVTVTVTPIAWEEFDRRALKSLEGDAEAVAGTGLKIIDDQQQGILIVSVEAETPAQRAGLRAGDRIVGIDDTRAESVKEVQRLLKRQSTTVHVIRDRRIVSIPLRK